MRKQKNKTYGKRHSAAALLRARRRLLAAGLSVNAFAKQNGVSKQAVIDVLYARSYGHTGNCHAAAVALGLKKDIPFPKQQPEARA